MGLEQTIDETSIQETLEETNEIIEEKEETKQAEIIEHDEIDELIHYSKEDLLQHNPLMDADVLNPMISVEDRVTIATRVATSLKKVLKSQNLIQKISGNEYVTVSGWSTLGTMLGIRVEIESVEPFPTKARFGYLAKVNLIDGRGVKVGEGAAIATSSNRQKEEHAVYSMAITRATGKAFRLSLAWIMELAGYSSTPYEEMPESMTGN